MTFTNKAMAAALLSTTALAMTSIDMAQAQVLEEIIVTAQRRETSLQTTPIAITAYDGDALAANKIFSVGDLANSVPAFSLTAGTPLDVELNIRGITNTRLDAPSADPSVGTFVDGIYVGRTGDLNYDFYDLERIEVIRGPQGVLLGKNVVGGALSIISAKPSFDSSGKVLVGYGNYDAQLVSGYVTGGLSDTIAGRFSFQTRNHDGYARDILHDREVEDLDSYQGRAQLLFTPEGGDLEARFMVDFNKDSTNGINVVAVDGGTPGCETSYLRTNCTRPWSNLRRFLRLTDPRVNMAQSVQYVGNANPTQQFMRRQNTGYKLDIEQQFDGFAFNSLTGYRTGFGAQLYDQTGLGPEALGRSVPRWLQYVAFVAATRPGGLTAPAVSNNGQFLFAEPVGEKAKVRSFSQEFRLTSTNDDSRFDWIAGVYYANDDIRKVDHFIGENFIGSLFVGNPVTGGPLATLSGETVWDNDGNNESYAAFAQVGFEFTDELKLTVGARYTEDKKGGVVKGTAAALGDVFNPTDRFALTPLAANTPLGGGFTQAYSEKWDKFTPQAILQYTPTDDFFVYASYAKGFKGGGYDDTPTSAIAANIPFDPEVVDNYELGFKASFLDRRMRLNASIFRMDYTDLQVTQTNAQCLCNLTDNAASAKIEGIEGEFEFIVVDGVKVSAGGSYVDPTYKDFIESAINPVTGQRLVSSGNRLQRTPKTQLSGGIDITTSVGSWTDALNFRADYTYQGNLFWATDNIAREPSYGLLDLRAALSPPEAAWQVAIYGKNVTNKLYRVNIIPFFGEEVSQFGAPRTYGVDLTLKF
ncbi:MAG: TonB-dependent receptor [Rhodospirillaceae bacterium]|nr:TonB-dependent receptor [Rhodospirillaceae bacterium]